MTTADDEYSNGTSLATPQDSAAAAVVRAANPTLSNSALITKLTSTARDLGATGKDNTYGHGLIDPLKPITGR